MALMKGTEMVSKNGNFRPLQVIISLCVKSLIADLNLSDVSLCNSSNKVLARSAMACLLRVPSSSLPECLNITTHTQAKGTRVIHRTAEVKSPTCHTAGNYFPCIFQDSCTGLDSKIYVYFDMGMVWSIRVPIHTYGCVAVWSITAHFSLFSIECCRGRCILTCYNTCVCCKVLSRVVASCVSARTNMYVQICGMQ